MAGERAVVDAGTDPSGTCTTCGHPAAPHPYRHPVTRGPGDLRGRQERPLVVPEDHAAALAVVTDWTERQVVPAHTTGELLELVGMIAAAIADGRARTLAPVGGPVRLVDSTVNVARRYWTAELRPRHEAAVRKAWAERLQLDGLRPLTWPAIVVVHLGYEGAPFPLDDRWRQLPPEHPDVEVVRLTISGDAVAAQ